MYAHCIHSYEDILQAKGFLRVHKSFMVNPKFILDNDENQQIMGNNPVVNVYREKKRSFEFLGAVIACATKQSVSL